MCRFQNENMCTISYDAVREANGDEPFTMSLTSAEEIAAVIAAVNQGIDAHLEACNCPERGDSFEPGQRTTRSGKVVTSTMECSVSTESLPVLLRRLFEDDPCSSLASSMLVCLGFNDSGEFVGREAMGLE